MPNAKYERDMPLIQQYWNAFITLVRQELNALQEEKRSANVEFKKLERIDKIIKRSQDDIDFLLLHKESILGLDNSLFQKFSILEAFKKINNLGNAVAIRTYNEILESKKIKSLEALQENLAKRKDDLQNQIDTINELIYGEVFSKELIDWLCEKHKIDGVARNAVLLYPIIKTLKMEKVFEKQEQLHEVERVIDNSENKGTDLDDVEILDISSAEKETLNWKEEYDKYKIQYEKLKEQIKLLLNKYFAIISEMSPVETQYYRIYCKLTDRELENTDLSDVHEEYDEAVAKIVAFRLFDAKDEIEKMLKELAVTDYSNKDEIDFLGEYISEYEVLSSRLKELDKKLVKTSEDINSLEESKVFFLTDESLNPFIPDVIKERGLQGSLINIIEKAQAGFIQRKKGSNIMPLKINDKKFKEECGRTVFAVRNSKIIVSYIKLNANTGISNDGGIMILTASLINPNTIQEDTNKVIKENYDQILKLIQAIEKGDTEQLALQSTIREAIIKSEEPSMKEGDINGR